MAVKTTTTYTCDRCGRESDSSDFANSNRSGSVRIEVEGREGMRGHDGAWGGYSYDKKADLCFSCADVFRKWFETFMTNPEPPAQQDEREGV